MKKILLSEKLILYFVLLGLGAIVIVSTVSFFGTKTALMNRTFDQLTSLRITKNNQVEQFFNDRIRDMQLLAGDDDTKMLATAISQNGQENKRRSIQDDKLTDVAVERINDQVDRYLSKYKLFQYHFIGFYLFSDPEESIGQCFSDSIFSGIQPLPIFLRNVDFHKSSYSSHVAITDESFDVATNRPRMFISAPVITGSPGQDWKNTTLILEVSIDAIDTIMLNNDPLSGLGLTGETYLVGSDYKMRSSSRFQPGSILNTVVKTAPVEAAIAGKGGCIISFDYRNIPVLSSYKNVSVHGLNWAILAEIDLKEAMIPIYETRTRILLLSVLILLVFFAFVFMISRHITKPIIRLKDATIKLGQGNYNMVLPVESMDEIGMLTESFNIMSRQIREKTSELQRERFGSMRSVIDGEEMERQRLSRELHDGIGQLLIAIKLRLEGLLYQDGKDIKNSIQELKKYFDQIIDEVRRISNNLMPSVLEAFGLAIAFRNLFTDTEELSGLRIHFEAKGDFDNLDKKVKTYIYRLTQEALSNIVKHAEAREVWVNLNREGELLSLMIRDDGKGFSPENAGKAGGNGIHNMRERVSLLDGRIEIRSEARQGTTIKVTIPIISHYASNQDFPRG